MKRAAFGLLCLFFLVPAAAFAQTRGSISSFGPTSFYSFELEQNATIHGVDLFGDFYGAPDSENIFLSTQLVVDGPAGTFTRDIGGGFRQPDTLNDTIYVAIPEETLFVEGRYSVKILAHDDTGDRLIGPVYYDVVARPVVPQPPLLGLPENVFAEATSASGANVNFEVTGFSYVDPAPVITCDHNSGSLFAIGRTTVQCTASDSSALTTTGSFEVFVLDTNGPVVTVPADIVTSNPVVTFTVTASDVIDGAVEVTCTPHSGSTFDIGTTTVDCIAYDSQANAGFGSFNVTVSNGPVLTLPADITAEATSAAGAAVTFTATATDNATVVCTPPSGSTFAIGTTTVNCTATATTGTASGSFHITVRDTTPPTIVRITASPNNVWPPDHKMYDITISVIATDLVDPSPVSHIVSVSSNQSDNANGDGNTPTDWTITGPLTLQLRAERDGTSDRIYTITIATTDSRGNTAQGTVTVSVSQTNHGNAVVSNPPANRGRAVRP